MGGDEEKLTAENAKDAKYEESSSTTDYGQSRAKLLGSF
jgi:hypothetical protein